MPAAGASSAIAHALGVQPPAEEADTASSTASTSGQHAGIGPVGSRGQQAGFASRASTSGQQQPSAASLASTLCNLEEPLGIIEDGDMFYSQGTARAALLAAGCCIQVNAHRLQGVACSCSRPGRRCWQAGADWPNVLPLPRPCCVGRQ